MSICVMIMDVTHNLSHFKILKSHPMGMNPRKHLVDVVTGQACIYQQLESVEWKAMA